MTVKINVILLTSAFALFFITISDVSCRGAASGNRAIHIRHPDSHRAISQHLSRLKRQYLGYMLRWMDDDVLVDYIREIKTENLPALLNMVDSDNMLHVVSVLPEKELMRLITSISVSDIMNMSRAIPPEQLVQLLSYIPVEGLINITASLDPAELLQMASQLPAETIVSLAQSIPPQLIGKLMKSLKLEAVLSTAHGMSPEVLAGLLTALPAEVILNLANSLISDSVGSIPMDAVIEVLTMLPKGTIANLTRAIPLDRLLQNLMTMTSALTAGDVEKIFTSISSGLLSEILSAVPPSSVGSLFDHLNKSDIERAMEMITPSMLSKVFQSADPRALVDIAKIIPEDLVSALINAMPPAVFRQWMEVIPVESIVRLMGAVFSDNPSRHSPEQIIDYTQKAAKIMAGISDGTLDSLFRAIPRDVLVRLITSLPDALIVDSAAILSGEEGVPLASAFPSELVMYVASIVPVDFMVHVVDVLPSRTIGAFMNMALTIPSHRLKEFHSQVPPDFFRNFVSKVPPKTIQKLASSVPQEAISVFSTKFLTVTMAPLVESLQTRDLKRIIRSVNTTTLSSMFSAIPQDKLAEVLEKLPPDKIASLLEAIPPEVIADLMGVLDPKAMLDLMKSMPPLSIESIMMKLPPEFLVNLTKRFSPSQLQAMMDAFPPSMVGKMIGRMPEESLVSLVSKFDNKGLLGMMEKLSPSDLLNIMSVLPPELILNITKSQTPQQTMKLIRSLPPGGLANFTTILPPEVLMEMMHSMPMDSLLSLVVSMPLKDLFAMGKNLLPAQIGKMAGRLLDNDQLLPSVLGTANSDHIMTVVRFLPLERLAKQVSSVASSLAATVGVKVMNVAKGMLQDKIHTVLHELADEAPSTFQECINDTDVLVDGLFGSMEWAFHFIDASGKPSRGLLEGNIHLIGNFDQCRKIEHSISNGSRQGDTITGSYCHVEFGIPKELLPPVPGDGVLPMPKMAWDVCLPSSCKDYDLFSLLQTIELPMKLTVPSVSCHQPTQLTHAPEAIVACLIIFLLFVFVAVSTITDVLLLRRSHLRAMNNNGAYVAAHDTGPEDDVFAVAKHQDGAPVDRSDKVGMEMQVIGNGPLSDMGDFGNLHGYKIADSKRADIVPTESVWLEALLAFSVLRTIKAVVGTRVTRRDMSDCRCLHGIRVLSMLWVIFGNVTVFGALYYENLLQAADLLTSLSTQVILNFSLAQDTFFTVSGFLTAVTFFRVVGTAGRLKPRHLLYYYVHRFVRIYPAYLVVLLCCVCLLGYISDGPHWPPPLQQQCSDQWWYNVLFINNYFVSVEHMCMSWTWFLSNLMQFYWLAPLMLIPLAFGLRLVGFLVMSLLLAVHITTTAVLESRVNGDIIRQQSAYLWEIYQQPWCRVAPFVLGVGLGFSLNRLHFRMELRKATVLVVWLLAVFSSTTITLISYSQNKDILTDATGWTVVGRTVYETLHRPLWSLVVCWVIFACSTGNGGWINALLGWNGFVPLSRLTYCVYLIHPVVIIWDLFTSRIYAYFSISYVVFRYLGYAVVSYALALLLSLLTEMPALALERALFGFRFQESLSKP